MTDQPTPPPAAKAASIKRAQEAEREAAAAAAGILREDAPRTPAEQAALAAIDRYRWVPVHAKDWNTAIVRLISIAGLLRDKQHEAEMAKFDAGMAEASARERRANTWAIAALDELARQAADRLDAGDDPAEVARWLRVTRQAIADQLEKAAAVIQPAESQQAPAGKAAA